MKGEMPFKMHKIIFFPEKKKYVCLPCLKFSDPLPETPLNFYLALCFQQKSCEKLRSVGHKLSQIWVFFCGSFLLFMFRVCLCHPVLSVPCSLVVTCWERADLLVLMHVMFSWVFNTFPYGIQSWARCDTWLYQFPIFAFFLNFTVNF